MNSITQTEIDKAIEIFNEEGRLTALNFVENNYGMKYRDFVTLVRKRGNYTYNKNTRKYETSITVTGEAQFLSLDNLFGAKIEAKSKANQVTTEFTPLNNAATDSLMVDLFQDRFLELSKYIKIRQSSKEIQINLDSLKKDGYRINLLE